MTRSLSQQDIASLDASQLTPAMRQYQTYKAQYPDAILFFRIGDFYETFYEDARIISRVLGVALTSRSKGENAVPMAGVPYHAVDSYLQRMIAAGYRVAICEQMEDPKQAKGVIDRQVTRLITPGTLTEDTMLDGREENFIAALVPLEKSTSRSKQNTGAQQDNFDSEMDSRAALAWCELSTGKFLTLVDSLTACREELSRIRPREMLIAETPDHQLPEWALEIKEAFKLTLTARPAWQLDPHHGAKALREHYGVLGFAGFGYTNDSDPALRVAGALVAYLHETQKTSLEHLWPPKPFERRRHLVIDQASLRSLEVLRTLRNNMMDGSLVWALDRTKTPMGSRLLRNWLLFPLRDPAAIEYRLQVVSDLMQLEQALEEIRLIIADCSDVERIGARICCRRATPRDLTALARSLDTLPVIVQRLKQASLKQAVLDDLEAMIPATGELSAAIRATLLDDTPAHLRDGGVIRDG